MVDEKERAQKAEIQLAKAEAERATAKAKQFKAYMITVSVTLIALGIVAWYMTHKAAEQNKQQLSREAMPAILILALPWIRNCLWRSIVFKVGSL